MYSGNAKNLLGAAVVAAVLAMPLAAGPVSAQPPVVIGGGGLVNLQIGSIEIVEDVEVRNVLNDLTVNLGVALNVAANVCNVAVGVLAQDLAGDGIAACETDDQFAVIEQ